MADPRAQPSAASTASSTAEFLADLEQELAWLNRLLDHRFKSYFATESATSATEDLAPPPLRQAADGYAGLVHHYGMTAFERAALILALVPHLRPQLLDLFHTRNRTFDRRFTEFGGHLDAQGDFQPSGETLAFLLGPNDLQVRLSVEALFGGDHFFVRHRILSLTPVSRDEPHLRGLLRVSEEYVALLTTGQVRRPDLSPEFPARALETRLEWSDLVLHPGTREQVGEIELWIRHGKTLLEEWGMEGKLRPGHRALFYGPPGTGKTMTATLLGRATAHPVYRIDLSLVVSKYIGETEKNLARIFDLAQQKRWILFFDEADALFGKRSETRDAHDRYANQEVSYLLQRIETFDGLAILASNQKENVDEAFMRRFESVIYFPIPRPEERVQIWRQAFPKRAVLDPSLDLRRIAEEHVLSGGSIMNIVRHVLLHHLDSGLSRISAEHLHRAIRREHAKEGKTV